MAKLEDFKFGTWYSTEIFTGFDGVDCLVSNGTHIGYISFFPDCGPTLYSQCKPFGKVTHWMPNPPLPQNDNKGVRK